MLIFPVLTAAVLAALTVSLTAQYVARGRPHQLAWAVALACGLLASVAFVGSALAGGNPWLFRVYYLGGAVLSAPLLGLGSTLLLPRRGPFWVLLAASALCAVVAAVGLSATPLDRATLAAMGIQPGAGLITSPLVIAAVIGGNSLGTIAVVGVALWSLLRSLRGHQPWGLTAGNALIVTGTLVIAAAGSLARLDHGAGFWAAMAGGWALLYAGVVALSASPAVHRQRAAASA